MADWNQVYSVKSIQDVRPADVLINNSQLLPSTGVALDYASGLSANGVYLAQQGFQVSAWDNSQVAVDKINNYAKQKNIALDAELIDLEKSLPPAVKRFDVIVVSYFLHRDTLRYLYDCLNENGLLFYQTFSGDQLNGIGPSRDSFRLQRGELLSVFSDMQLLSYQEDCFQPNKKDNKSDQVLFVAQKIKSNK